MNNLTKDIDKLIDILTSLKRAINKFNRNSEKIKIINEINEDGFSIFLINSTKKDFNKLTQKRNCILDSIYDPYYDGMYINIYLKNVYPKEIDKLITTINKIFKCLNPNVPKKSEFEEHCELASELVEEWPQWKKDATKHVPYTYEPPDPQ